MDQGLGRLDCSGLTQKRRVAALATGRMMWTRSYEGLLPFGRVGPDQKVVCSSSPPPVRTPLEVLPLQVVIRALRLPERSFHRNRIPSESDRGLCQADSDAPVGGLSWYDTGTIRVTTVEQVRPKNRGEEPCGKADTLQQPFPY